MQKRQLGNSGIEVAPLAIGGNVFGWTADESTSFRVLDAFIDGVDQKTIDATRFQRLGENGSSLE